MPSVVTWLVPQSNQSIKVTLTATPASKPAKNIQGFVEYLCRLEQTRKKGSNSTLLFRKACLRLLEDNDNNRNATAKQILTWMGRMEGDKATKQNRLDSFTALMRTWLKCESDLASVDLGAVFNYWQEHGQLPKSKSTATAVVRPAALRTGPKPIYGELEIVVADWVEQQAALKIRVSRLSVIKKALELRPDMYGGISNPDFMVKARGWYYRWKDRQGFSIRMITSKGKKKPEGWEGMWSAQIRDFHQLRASPEILQRYHQYHPHAQVTILPISECGDSDQTPVPVECVANSTLVRKGSKDVHVSTGGKEKDRSTVMLTAWCDGRKCKPLIVFKGQ